jgi:hypothetical protein
LLSVGNAAFIGGAADIHANPAFILLPRPRPCPCPCPSPCPDRSFFMSRIFHTVYCILRINRYKDF